MANSRRDAEPTIWLIGPLPPPLHGQAVYNEAFAPRLRRHGRLQVLPTGDRLLRKLVGYARATLVALFRMRRTDIVYLSLPAHASLWLFAVVVLALRLRGIRHFVHHHSFRPIAAAPVRVVSLIARLGGARQHHILLSPVMRDRFAALYLGPGGAARAHALSNALLFCPGIAQATPRPTRPVTIGHMSVLTRDKGVDTLLRLFRTLARSEPHWRLVIAGPIADEALTQDLAAAVAELPGQVEYRGTLVGEAKNSFWADIDLFVLPTRLLDEAEPLVMLEGYAAGVDFLATARGCIPERVRRADRLLSGSDPDDAAAITAAARDGEADWGALRDACVRHAAALRTGAEDDARALFAVMLPSPI